MQPVRSGDTNEKLMNLNPESLLRYREIVADSNERIEEIDKNRTASKT